jgi:acetyl/propionyl-CoA carboxylase alpha subunit
MLAKLIVWAADRKRALDRLGRALTELRLEGIRTTVPLFRALLADADFRAGNLDINLLDRKLAAGGLTPPSDCELDDLPLLAAVLAHHERVHETAAGPAAGSPSRRSRWSEAGRQGALRNGPWT